MALLKNGNAHVLEISNKATLQALYASSLPGITARLDNHESGLNPNAHGVQNIGGLQAVLDGKASVSHTHTISNVTGLQSTLDGKEPLITKKTAFNKDFGSAIGTVCEGNDSRLSDSREPLAHTHAITDVVGLDVELANKADKSVVTQDIVVVTGVDFVAQTIITATVKVVDGIIVEII